MALHLEMFVAKGSQAPVLEFAGNRWKPTVAARMSIGSVLAMRTGERGGGLAVSHAHRPTLAGPSDRIVGAWLVDTETPATERADERSDEQRTDGGYGMRFKDIVTTEILSLHAPASAAPDGPRGALPLILPRPVKLTRNRRSGPSPPAHVRMIGGAIDDEDRDYIGRKLGMRLGKFRASIERITVRVSDTNGPRGGRDQKCQVKVVLSGLPSVVVNETDSTLPRAIDRAVDATAIAVRRRVERRRLKPLHHRSSHTTTT
jgi:ribosome-associated translation inhibitor RaiA